MLRLPRVAHSIQGHTSWGVPDDEVSIGTLRRLNAVYALFGAVCEALAVVGTIAFVVIAAHMLFNTSFEDVAFFDGTDHLCVFDSATGSIRYVDGK